MVENFPCSEDPLVANTKKKKNVEKMKEIVLENCHTNLRKLVNLMLYMETAQFIEVYILGMRRVIARLIPKYLNFIKKYHRKTVSEFLISEGKNDLTFMK